MAHRSLLSPGACVNKTDRNNVGRFSHVGGNAKSRLNEHAAVQPQDSIIEFFTSIFIYSGVTQSI